MNWPYPAIPPASTPWARNKPSTAGSSTITSKSGQRLDGRPVQLQVAPSFL